MIALSPAPTPDEAAAIVVAIQAVLDAERSRAPHDPLPAAYRSRWRQAAILEAAELTIDDAGRLCVS